MTTPSLTIVVGSGSAQTGGWPNGEERRLPTTRAAMLYVQRRTATGEIKARTAYNHRWVLLDFARAMGSRPVEQIGRSDIERWLATHQHHAVGTRRVRFTVVRRFFDDLVDRGKVRRSPMRGLKAPKVPRAPHRALTANQCADLLAHADATMRVAILLGLQCGLRRAEVAGIELGDIDWHEPSVKVTGKGGHQRIVHLPTEAAEAVRVYLLERGDAHSGALMRLPSHPERPMRPGWLGERFAEIAYAAGVKQGPSDGVSFHALRHTAATDIFRRSKNVVIVRDVLGHANLATTQTYVAGMDRSAMAAAMEGRTYQADVA